MPLILAIQPDRRQGAQLSVVVRKRVSAELILVDTTERALDAIGNRVPDLVLVPALLSPQDDAALAAALRVIATAAHVQMLTIPVLGAPRPQPKTGGVLSALRRDRGRSAEPDGCDPAVFAEQIASYLERADEERASEGGGSAENAFAAPLPIAPELFGGAAVPQEYVVAAHEEIAPQDNVIADFMDDASGEVEPAVDSAVESAVDSAAAIDLTAPAIDDGVIATEHVSTAAFEEDAPPAIDQPDESVTAALEEAMRTLFASAAPTSDPPELFTSPASPVATPVEAHPLLEPMSSLSSIEELMAALEQMPLGAIDVPEEGDWASPAIQATMREAAATPGASENATAGRTDLSDLERELKPVEPLLAHAAKSEREWVALIESLRLDVERLRAERSEKPASRPAAVRPAAARPAAPRPARSGHKAKPIQDEWGLFDPDQCGFAALLAKLEEVTDTDDGFARVTTK